VHFEFNQWYDDPDSSIGLNAEFTISCAMQEAPVLFQRSRTITGGNEAYCIGECGIKPTLLNATCA